MFSSNVTKDLREISNLIYFAKLTIILKMKMCSDSKNKFECVTIQQQGKMN